MIAVMYGLEMSTELGAIQTSDSKLMSVSFGWETNEARANMGSGTVGRNIVEQATPNRRFVNDAALGCGVALRGHTTVLPCVETRRDR